MEIHAGNFCENLKKRDNLEYEYEGKYENG
jgi:hypothetical protein